MHGKWKAALLDNGVGEERGLAVEKNTESLAIFPIPVDQLLRFRVHTRRQPKKSAALYTCITISEEIFTPTIKL